MLRQYIEFNEGRAASVYLDSLDVPNIGVGFNLTRDGAPELLDRLSLNRDDLLSGSASLSDKNIDYLLNHDTAQALDCCARLFSNFPRIPLARQIVLGDMAFNLGESRFKNFLKLKTAIVAENWVQAADEMTNSKWATQVGVRATRNIEVMTTNNMESLGVIFRD